MTSLLTKMPMEEVVRYIQQAIAHSHHWDRKLQEAAEVE